MRLLTSNNRIIGTATEDYTGSTPFIQAPADFDLTRIAEYTVTGNAASLPAPPTLAELKAAAVKKIDVEVDNIYGDVVGNKAEEYRSAEADAKAFALAGYTGAAGGGVTSWATAKGWTTTQAANDIIAQANAWRGAQSSVRANRLGKKEAVKSAADIIALNAAMAQWAGFVIAIRGQLGI